MDRLTQLRGEAGSSRDSTLDTSSPPSEAFMTANESSSKYFSLSEVDSTFDISPIKDVSLTSANTESEKTVPESDQLISNLSPIGKKDFMDGYKIGKQIEAANILSGGVDIFDDNENSYDGDELVIDDNAENDEKSNPDLKLADSSEASLVEADAVPSKDIEVILQIDGKNVDAIDIGNGLYLYRKQGQEELAAVQIIDDDQHQPSFKFLKVRENAEGNLEVYEEIQIEVPNEVPMKEEKVVNKSVSHVPIKDINKVISDATSNKIAERKSKTLNVIPPAATVAVEPEIETDKEVQVEPKSETSKKIKFSESRKSPVIGSFTPMTFHSTPNKEGIPLTKTMVDQQLHPNRHSDNIKKTIEVHTDSAKQRTLDPPGKTKDTINDDKNKSVLAEKDEKNIILELGPVNKEFAKKKMAEADVIKDTKIVEDGNLILDKKGDELVNVNKQLNTAENLKVKLPDIFKTGDKKSLESPVTETNINKSEINKMDIVEEISEPAAENKLTKNIGQTKSPSVEDTIVNKKLEPTKENKKTLDEIVDVDHNDLEIKSREIVNKVTEVPKIDSNDDHSLKIEPKNKIVIDNQFLIEAYDEVDGRMCSDNIQKQIDQTIKNSTDVIIIQDSNNRVQDKEELQVKADNGNKKSKPQDKEKSEKVMLYTKTDERVTKNSTAEPIKQKVNKSDNTEQQKLTSATKPVNEKIDEKPTLPQKQHDIQEGKECKTGNTLSALKSDLPVSPNSGEPSTMEPKVQSITIANDTLSDLKSDLPISAISRETSKIKPNVQSNNIANEHEEIKIQDIKPVHSQNIKTIPRGNNESVDKKPLLQIISTTDSKPINNNHAAVPFGKWTEVNRQAFLNRIKESKVPTNSSNGKQIKNSNDLNRRDVLKKIDSQRSSIASAKAQELKTESQRQSGINTAKTQDFGSATRMGVKKEAALANKQPASQESKQSKLAVKTETPILKNSSVPAKKTKQETIVKPQIETVTSSAIDIKKESKQRKEINNQDLIDKTIEEIINRPIPAKNPQEAQAQRCYDEIEMKMNELHGKPFIERPIHELPPAQKIVTKTYPKSEHLKATVSKPSKIPNLLPFNKTVKENAAEIDSEEEVIIEHEPITGDMDLDKNKATKIIVTDKLPVSETVTNVSVDSTKQEAIITEKDFDKFVRRNSISYENCLTVNFDGKEPHNVIQSVVQKDVGLKTYSKIESRQHDAKVLSPRKRELFISNSHLKTAPIAKYGNTIIEDDGKNYQSKVKMAYQTAMTAKRQMEQPITIIEDRPVKVVYMDTNTEFISNQLNVRGKELSPAKKPLLSVMSLTTFTTDSQNSDNTLDSIEEEKLIDDIKIKTKHQRKQVLTPVETPELELIEPNDLGIEVSPKKKRKTEEKVEKNMKTLVPKKSYLLGRGNMLEDSPSKSLEFSKTSQRETMNQDISHKNTASAIDSLVKAAELLETQSENMPTKVPDTPTSDSQQNTPVKRGRGRPRKYPLPEETPDKKSPSPQKKPRLIDAKVVKNKDTDDDSSTDDDVLVKENWTMGKINENIVCPICKKLFRSENVVFKHVKHCTGPSPSRSDSENKSPRRFRESQESESRSYESKSEDMEIEENETSHKDVRLKRKSKDSQQKTVEKDDIIIIEDTPLKAKPNKDDKDKRDEAKPTESKKAIHKSKIPDKVSSLVCEFCGKTFRQLSYLVSHRLQHGKDNAKKTECEPAKTNTTIFSCEVCKKEFRKLHHLVQHRIIHNPSNVSAKMSRKSSSEQNDNKVSKEPDTSKPNEEASSSSGFRCEPCDKSFRKLHHLVEHRETHDGINRQKNIPAVQAGAEKPPPRCEICKKTFRKLHHLIEHKEQHLETSSEKSDDKSIKSSLSTKDIIHECSLCYMVFPNEHSLNKHTIICQRKKRQSATKQIKVTEGNETEEGDTEIIKIDDNKAEKVDDDVTIVTDPVVIEEIAAREVSKEVVEDKTENKMEIVEEPVKLSTLPVVLSESLKPDDETDKKEDNKPIEPIKPNPSITELAIDLVVKVKKSGDKEIKPKMHDTPRKKTPLKDKAGPTVTKRHKPNVPLPVIESKAPKLAESSDDDEARYMLNPDYKFDDNEGKLFMKVRANKRNSLQIERPNSKDLVKRRISLQHPLKVPRLKAKAIQNKIAQNLTTSTKTVAKATKPEPEPSTDSDDSDVKYSFPKNAPDKIPKSNLPEASTKDPGKKTQRKSLADKRKSLSSIAKRKSLGKAVGAKHKVKPSPVKQVRKRTTEVEHRCDCGQLFSSAALLARHAVLAHTPPRVRRRRSPPPDPAAQPAVAQPAVTQPAPRPRPSADSRKSTKTDAAVPPKTTLPTKRKSSIKPEHKTPKETRKSPKSSEKTDVKSAPTNVKLRRYAAHKGVPVPEKMRKLMEKSKK